MQKHIIQRIGYDCDKVLQSIISETLDVFVLLGNFTTGINPMKRDLTSSHRLGTASHSATAMVGGTRILTAAGVYLRCNTESVMGITYQYRRNGNNVQR